MDGVEQLEQELGRIQIRTERGRERGGRHKSGSGSGNSNGRGGRSSGYRRGRGRIANRGYPFNTRNNHDIPIHGSDRRISRGSFSSSEQGDFLSYEARNNSRFSASEPIHRMSTPQTQPTSSDMSTWNLPMRWKVPPWDLLQTRFRDHRLDKMWKYGHHVTTFSGEYKDYPSWAATFYDMVHIQPIPLTFKFSLLSQKLSSNVRETVLNGLNHTRNDYITALQRMERYFGGTQRLAQSAFSSLEKIDKITIQDWKSARQMLNLIESYINMEPENLRPDSQQNISLMFLIRRRFPPEWFLKYKLWLSEKNWNMVPSSFLMWAHAFIEAQAETTEWNSQEAITKGEKRKPSRVRI